MLCLTRRVGEWTHLFVNHADGTQTKLRVSLKDLGSVSASIVFDAPENVTIIRDNARVRIPNVSSKTESDAGGGGLSKQNNPRTGGLNPQD